MFNRLLTSAIFSATAVFTVSIAQAGPIEDRQAKMEIVGKSMGIVGKMAKGQAAFDGAAALAAFVAMKDATGF